MSKLRKFIVTPHLYWRDFLLKRDLNLGIGAYRFPKIPSPLLSHKNTVHTHTDEDREKKYKISSLNKKISIIIRDKDYIQAESLFNRYIPTSDALPDKDRLKFYQLYALSAEGYFDWISAAQRWQKVLELEGELPEPSTLYHLGNTLSRSGNRTKAEDIVLRGITLTAPTVDSLPSRIYLDMHALYATIAERKKDWSTAIERWQKRISLGKNSLDIDSICRIANCYNLAGDHNKAESTIQWAMDQLPVYSDDGIPNKDYLRLSKICASFAEHYKKWDEAAERWQDIINIETKKPNPQSYCSLINALTYGHNFKEAEKIIRDSVAIFPDLSTNINTLIIFDHNIFGKSRMTSNYSLIVSMLSYINDYVKEKKAKFIISIHPYLDKINNLSKEEQIIRRVKESKVHIIRRKYPKDIADALTRQEQPSVLCINGIYKHEDYSSKHINFRNGFRKTIGCPSEYKNTVYFVASSRYCMNSDDKNTIPSQLQSILNDNKIPLRVMNFSHAGARIQHVLNKIKSIDINEGDTILVDANGLGYNNLFSILDAHGIQYINFNENFREKRYIKDMFLDKSHVLQHAHKEIALLMYRKFFSSYSILNSPIQKWADGFVRAVDTGEFFKESNYQESSAMDIMASRVDVAYSDVPMFVTGKVGCIIMNCNPITLGHLHLITLASQIVNHLYIFVVEEDRSAFPFADRIEMIRRATTHLKNVVVTPSGRFILSAETFPEYFEKDMKQNVAIDTSQDIGIFGKYVAKKFNISIRFVGEEPTDAVTRQYNEEMKNSLPKYGVQVIEIPRLESGDEAISASRVRRLLKDRLWDDIARICPQTTVDYLIVMDKEGRLTV